MKDVRTLLQSGNVIFRSAGRTTKQLERMFEDAAAKELNIATDFFVRTAAQWQDIVAGNPFAAEAKRDPGHLLVMTLRNAPEQDNVTALQKAITGRERIRAQGACAYIVYPDGVGRSRLTTALIEKKLGTRGTGRNWNTVVKLQTLAGVSTQGG
jgi:uncharacterized protein (DUF1697 family)